jgi:Protein of unknown function DUF262
MTRRTKPTPITAPVAAPRPEVPDPPWAVSRGAMYDRAAYPYQWTMSQLARWTFHLPPCQRPSVWSPEQQVAFCRSVWDGRPVAPLLVWQRGHGKDERAYVIDGQQRLIALGCNVIRHDGTQAGETRAYLDIETGEWSTVPDDLALTAARVSALRSHDWLRDDHRSGLWQAMAYDRLGGVQIVAYVLGYRATAEDVIESFRAINRPGVPMTEAQVEALVAMGAE